MIEFSVPFCAGKQRPRIAKSRMYKSSDEAIREEAIAIAFDEAGGKPAPKGIPVFVRIEVSKKNQRRAGEPFVVKPDADNVAKLVLDALNGKAWHDDAQVTEITVEKRAYTEKQDRISVKIDWRME